MKLSEAQREGIETLAALAAEYRTAQTTATARVRREVEAEVSAALIKRDTYAYRLHAMGVPKARIGRDALGTSDPKTVNEAIANGSRYAVPALLSDPLPTAEPVAAAPAVPFSRYRPNPSTDPRVQAEHPFLFEYASPKTGVTITGSYNPRYPKAVDVPALWTDEPVDQPTITDLQMPDNTAQAVAWINGLTARD